MKLASLPGSLWAFITAASSAEKDPGFRRIILRISRNGMYVVGMIGFGCVFVYLGAYIVILDLPLTWEYGPGRPVGSIVLWDKLVVVLLSGISIALARSPAGPEWGRLVVSLMAAAVAVAFLLDDLAGGNLLNSYVYLVILMITVVGTMPYRPWQILAVCLGIMVLYYLAALLAPGQLGEAWQSAVARRMVPMALVAIICSGISALIYRSRYEQYLALRKAGELNEQVRHQNEHIRLQSDRTLRQNEALQEMERTKSRFFANVSHELRTPLTLILGPLKDALRGAYGSLPETLHNHLGMMERNGVRLQRLIDELLELARLEAGEAQLEAEDHELVAFVQSVVLSFMPLAERLQIDLQFSKEIDHLQIRFDAKKLDHVLYNILSNALKFTPRHGKIRVNVRKLIHAGKPSAQISVKDTGRGILPEHLPRVFDRFFHLRDGESDVQEGTGIGLTIAREFVALHGGEIAVESEAGFGSTFVVSIPCEPALADGAADSIAQSASRRSPGFGLDGLETGEFVEDIPDPARIDLSENTPLVLVVDDRRDLRLYLESVFSKRYRVAVACDGHEALDMARELRPSLIICDVMMPRMDGLEFCRTLRSDVELSAIPVILLTARADDESKLDGLGVGADDYLTKPFDALELLARAENLIEIRRLLRQRFSGEVMIHGTDVSVPSRDAQFLEQLRVVVEAEIGNSNFGVSWLAEEMNVSSRQLQRRLKSCLGISAAGYIQMLRLERASTLLRQRAGSVAEVCYQVGYRDPSYFSKVYKQAFGVPPSHDASAGTGGPGEGTGDDPLPEPVE